MTATQPAALLLDLDGTLIDSEPLHRATIRNWLTGRGWAADDDVVHQFTGQRATDVFANVPGPWAGENPDALMAEMLSGMDHTWVPSPMPGAVELLRRAECPIALVTSASRHWAEHCIATALGGYPFDTLVTAADVTDGKPAPDGYLLACRRLTIDPAQAWTIEDAPAGVAAAVAAGVGRVFALTTTFPMEVLTAAGAHQLIGSLAEVVDLLGSQ